MSEWPPLATPGRQALAALCALKGRPDALNALESEPAPLDPVVTLSQALGTRRTPPPLGRPQASGPAPAARLLRRLSRRARFGLPILDHSPQTLPALRQAFKAADADRRRALLANTPAPLLAAFWASR